MSPAPPSPPASPHLRLLDPLRGIASLWVLTYHYPFSPQFQQAVPFAYAIARSGDLGVSLFFVISGYCLAAAAHASLSRDPSALAFLGRRCRRIYLAYWFALALAVATPFIVAGLHAVRQGPYLPPVADNLDNGFMRYGAWDWVGVITLVPHAFATIPGANTLADKFWSTNAAFWSLAVEVQFYVILACALAWGKRWWQVLMVVTVVSLPVAAWTPAYVSGWALPFWPMFAIGVAVYGLRHRGLTLGRLLGPRAGPVGLCLATGLVLAFLVFTGRGGHLPQVVTGLGFGASVMLAEPSDGFFIPARLHDRSWAVRTGVQCLLLLGSMSYSLYLVHSKLIVILWHPLKSLMGGQSMAMDGLTIVLTLVAAWAFYLCFERPFIPRRAGTPPLPIQPAIALPVAR